MQNDEVAYKPGQVLAGKYRVERVLGVGGFGVVLAATHMQLEEQVAIKVLLPSAAKNPAAAARFLREARAAVRIRSEHVARVSDVGSLEDGVPYMVMEYLDGLDLSAIVKQRGRQRIDDVAEWILQACEAIAEAHSLGIVHRDLKPANLFLTLRVDGTPSVKVLDFGISKLTNETGDKGMTKTSDVMGSPFYMSPEQMRSTRDVDARSDVWALGAILFELLAGAPPFDAETMTALVVSIMQEPPRELSQYRNDVPMAMRTVVMRCLEKDRGRRYPDVAELAEALRPFAPERSGATLSKVLALSGRTSQPIVRTSSADMGAGPTTPGMPSYPSLDAMPMATTPQGGYGGRLSGSNPPAPTQIDGSTMEGLAPPSVAMRPNAMSATAASQSWAGTMAGTAPRASRMPIFVGIGALSIAALAGGGFLYLQSQKSDVPKTSAGIVDMKTTPVATATATATAKATQDATSAPTAAGTGPDVAPANNTAVVVVTPSKTATTATGKSGTTTAPTTAIPTTTATAPTATTTATTAPTATAKPTATTTATAKPRPDDPLWNRPD